ncbi:hypothetical protein H0O45_27300, partial [Escherichia coli]|nr:hypothetical protein [Escherichia coli]
IGHHAQILFEDNAKKGAYIQMEISPTEEFGVEDLAFKEKTLLHELAHQKQLTMGRLTAKKAGSTISEKAAEKSSNYYFKSQ